MVLYFSFFKTLPSMINCFWNLNSFNMGLFLIILRDSCLFWVSSCLLKTHWCCSILLTTALQDPLTSDKGRLSILPIICFSQNLVSLLILPYKCQNILRSEKKTSTALWIGNTCFSSFNGTGCITALRVPLLVQLFCYLRFKKVLYFLYGSCEG